MPRHSGHFQMSKLVVHRGTHSYLDSRYLRREKGREWDSWIVALSTVL